MRRSSTAGHSLRALFPAFCAGLLCTAALAGETTEQAALIAPPGKGVDSSLVHHLVSIIEAALDGCSGASTPNSSTPTGAHSGVSTSPYRISTPELSGYYPVGALFSGDQAIGQESFLVDALGNIRFAHVVRAVPANPRGGFYTAADNMVRDFKMMPGTIDGQPVAMWWQTRLIFCSQPQGSKCDILSKPRIAKLLKDARRGDVSSMAMAQHLNAFAAREVPLTMQEQRSYLIHAMLAGFREAQVQLAQSLSAPACRQDPEVQEVFHNLIWRGNSGAALNEATRLLNVGDPSTYGDIGILLHGAANASDAFVQLWATGLLATIPVAQLRDPVFALQSALSLKNEDQDPDYTEMLAAAQAANEQFDDAVRSETLAVAQAKKRHWNDAQLRLRLATYQSQKAWTGYLCDCDGRPP